MGFWCFPADIQWKTIFWGSLLNSTTALKIFLVFSDDAGKEISTALNPLSVSCSNEELSALLRSTAKQPLVLILEHIQLQFTTNKVIFHVKISIPISSVVNFRFSHFVFSCICLRRRYRRDLSSLSKCIWFCLTYVWIYNLSLFSKCHE